MSVIMARMRFAIIENNDPAAASSRLRYFSMLSMPLHRVVFDLVERIPCCFMAASPL
jgi:hypothetical protein